MGGYKKKARLPFFNRAAAYLLSIFLINDRFIIIDHISWYNLTKEWIYFSPPRAWPGCANKVRNPINYVVYLYGKDVDGVTARRRRRRRGSFDGTCRAPSMAPHMCCLQCLTRNFIRIVIYIQLLMWQLLFLFGLSVSIYLWIHLVPSRFNF